MIKNTFQQVLDKMTEVALSGFNEADYGSPWDIEEKARKYPLLFIDPHLKTNTWQHGVLKCRMDIYVMDLVYQDDSNEKETLSNMISFGTQYINHLTAHLDDYGFYIRKNNQQTINFQTFTEKFDDYVTGARFEITIDIPDDGSLCENIFYG